VKGGCVPTPGSGCTLDSQCPTATPKCVAGTCEPACTADSQCPTGDYCDQGACVIDTRPKPNCMSNTDCLGTQQCIGGYCRYSCTSVNACQTIFVLFTHCIDMICKTDAEASPQCTSQADCTPPQSCVSNVCR
jgi:hypothetical protein